MLSGIPDFAKISQPPLFTGQLNADWQIASEAWLRIQDIFKKLDEFRAFELLRNGRERADYLLVLELKYPEKSNFHCIIGQGSKDYCNDMHARMFVYSFVQSY
jgi:hypothetical protein